MDSEHLLLVFDGIVYLFIAWWVVSNVSDEEEEEEDAGAESEDAR